MRRRGAIVDLDGTVYRSNALVEGADAGVDAIRRAGFDVLFLSNTSTKSRAACLDRLRRLGIEATLDDVVTSASIAADYVSERYPNDPTMAVGSPALFEELERVNQPLTDDPTRAEVVVVGKDRGFDYETLTAAFRALDGGSPFVAACFDRTSPIEGGEEPGTAGIVASIAAVAGRDPDAIVGKPNETAIRLAAQRLRTSPRDCWIVGDNLETDIRMGERAGCTTVLVLSGVATRADVSDSEIAPDYVLESFGEIESVLDA